MRHDALPGRQRKAATDTIGLAETALDTFVDYRGGKGQRFHAVHKALGVIIEYDTGIQQLQRVESFFEPLHYCPCLGAPF